MLTPPLTVIRVEPTGYREVTGLVEYADGTGAVDSVDLPSYPASPRGKELRALRRSLMASVQVAGGWFGLTSVDIIWLEAGVLTLSDADWERALGAMRAAALKAGRYAERG